MSRLLSAAFCLLASLSALAQEAKEVPTEKASPLVVVLFLVIFVGSGVAYAGYLWWQNKRDKTQVDK